MNHLILLRHGQSQWNLENRFTGWKDVPLTEKGINEAKKAGLLLQKYNTAIDEIYSSNLKRANKTAEITIKEMKLDRFWKNDELIMIKSERLNERNYGDLVGLNKDETANKYGKQQVQIWRRSYDIAPPGGESLKDVVERVQPFFDKFITPNIKMGKNILIVAHGNSLRASMIQAGLYEAKEISEIEIPTGSPFKISYDNGKIVSSKFLK